jgi:hypothetical protein
MKVKKKMWRSVFVCFVSITLLTGLVYGQSDRDLFLYLANKKSLGGIFLLNLVCPNLGTLFLGNPKSYGIDKPSGFNLYRNLGYLALIFYGLGIGASLSREQDAKDTAALGLGIGGVCHFFHLLGTIPIVREFNDSLQEKYGISQSQMTKSSRLALKIKIIEIRF